jgi:hypothetical protein
MRDSRARDHPTSRTGTDGAVKTAYRNGSRRQDRVQEGVASSRPRTGTGRAVKTAYRNLETDHGFGTVRAPTAFERRRGKDRRDQSSRRLAVGRDALASGRRDALASGRRDALASGRAGRPAAATVVPRGDRGPARSSLGSVGKTRGPRGASASAESLTPRPTGWPWSKRAGQRPPPAKAAPEGRAGTLAEAAGAPGTFTGTAKAAGIRRLAAKGAKGFRRDMAWLDGGEARGCRARPESGGDVGACWGKVMP